jgi:hypothetical protein
LNLPEKHEISLVTLEDGLYFRQKTEGVHLLQETDGEEG